MLVLEKSTGGIFLNMYDISICIRNEFATGGAANVLLDIFNKTLDVSYGA